MWRLIKRGVIAVAIFAFLVWSGLFWAFLGAVPLWTYVIVAIMSVALIAFIRWAWLQNDLCEDPKPVEYLALEAGEDIIDAEVIDD
jgi:hypothetical protein